ncbi:MAG: aldehyde dehydrogenase, partial [Bdellovibrionales bacterium]|nr:aldehyde dehydrogenase [Bdellovibrionales bacterium]
MFGKSINPYDEQVFAEYQNLTADQIEGKLKRADRTFKEWKMVLLEKRMEVLSKVGHQLDLRKKELA